MVPFQPNVSEETIKRIKKEWNDMVKDNKQSFRTPIFTEKILSVDDAFEMMHKQDGTPQRGKK